MSNNVNPPTNSTLGGGEETSSGGRLLHLYNNKRNELPPLKKSISRNTLLLNNNSSSMSPTRPLFNNSSGTNNSSQQQPSRVLTVESAVFPENQPPLFPSDSTLTKKSSSTPVITGDARSVISGTESTRSNKRQQKKKAGNYTGTSFINPTDIFAQNLSDAVMDADDSDDLECYVYRDKPNNTASYTIPPWSYNNNSEIESSPYYYDKHYYYSSTGTETDGCESGTAAYNKEKYTSRRPVLRSTVSEIPHSNSFRSNTSQKKFSSRPFSKHHHYYTNPSEDEEFTPLVRSRPLRRRKGTSSHNSYTTKSNARRTCFTFICVISGCLFVLCLLWILLAIYASPLTDVEVVGISNVLGTQKELIFNLQVRAKNSNWWTIRMTNTAFSVFASSHFVPTALLAAMNNNATITSNDFTSEIDTLGADPAEFLGTIYHLEDPLIYQSGGLFQSVVSTATSQIQIKNPGSTKDDTSGNARWSLLIRYPYELTVRGVLKYQILPYFPTLTQLHSVRVCKMSRIDPATGKISDDIPLPETSICDDPSPVEGSLNYVVYSEEIP